MTRLIVENVHRTSSRPWAFVTGRLEGGELHIGDELAVTHGSVQGATAVVRSIELHSAPDRTTIAIDTALADTIQSGTVLTQAT
jgi:translation elongation factor EF-Tu-like GTPase